MKVRLHRISPASSASTLAAIFFLIGVFAALFGLFLALSGVEFKIDGPLGYNGSGTSMLPILIAYPFITAVSGAITGFVVAWIYNIVARFTKGVIVEFSDSPRFED